MSFSIYDPTVLRPGESKTAEYRHFIHRPDPVLLNPGAQFSMASPRGPTELQTTMHAKRFEVAGDVFIFSATVTNIGSVASDFDFQGGGLT